MTPDYIFLIYKKIETKIKESYVYYTPYYFEN